MISGFSVFPRVLKVSVRSLDILFSRIFIRSLNARIDLESQENWRLAQNGRLDWVGGGDREKSRSCRHLWKKVNLPFLQKRKIPIGWRATKVSSPWQRPIMIALRRVLRLAAVVITDHPKASWNFKRTNSGDGRGFLTSFCQQKTTYFWLEMRSTSLFSEDSGRPFVCKILKHVIERRFSAKQLCHAHCNWRVPHLVTPSK